MIFLLGLGLRIYGLGTESLWYDEAVSVSASRLGIADQITWNLSHSDNNPPLYYSILHCWVSLFGDSEFSVRFPSAIFGSLSILAIYAIGNLLFGRKTGLIAALILATSVFHVWFSQEARAYTLLTLFTLLSFYYFLRLVSAPQDKL
ncbi:MAG TPA: glycosyltransferase family 39 protein, partial [Thermodesulfobacteriota bacterium]|nr:glycosyltransferase family 39 protein [Thermodesulfobacteriota bacterium]